MKYPTLPVRSSSKQMLDAFKGYNHNLRIGETEFFDMKNMSSDHYPVLAPRNKRGVYATPTSPQGLIAKDALCYVDGADFVIGSERVNMDLSTEPADCPKKLVSMGAYVIILPDKKYINTLDVTDFGCIDAEFESTSEVIFSVTAPDESTSTLGAHVASTAPKKPFNQQYWIDTSSSPPALKQYSESTGTWVSISQTYVKISATGIGTAFSKFDSVTISGVNGYASELNTDMVIWDCDDDYIVVPGIFKRGYAKQTLEEGAITIKRKMPEMDFVIESGNRLWGCRYGTADNGEAVNEIYASKLGDFKNWKCFMGVSTDSYTASLGSDGPFTGAISHGGYPLFFKEGCLHKVYGSYPANFQIQTVTCSGVQQGCDRSMAIINGVLYYKARHAVCAYDGAMPSEISSVLGEARYSDAVAGAHENKYYISMKDASNQYHLFVCDIAKGMWHKEDNLRADCFCAFRGELYCIAHDGKEIITMLGSGTQDTDKVQWMVQTGVIGTDMPGMKYISKLLVRLSMELGSQVNFFAQYDSTGSWEPLGTVKGTHLRTFLLPIRPRRCDHLRLRMEGTGDAKIYSITKTIAGGSDIP